MELTQLSSQKNIIHCPYNPSHTMPHKTLAIHLTKCPEKPKNYSTCSFNSLHVMPIHQKENHEMNCPDRIAFDVMLYEQESTVRPITEYEKAPTVVCDESWDDPTPSSNQPSSVVKTINQRPNFMKPAYGLTKVQRKKFRSEMNSKYSNVDVSFNPNLSIAKRQDSSSSNNNTKPDQENELFIGKRPDN